MATGCYQIPGSHAKTIGTHARRDGSRVQRVTKTNEHAYRRVLTEDDYNQSSTVWTTVERRSNDLGSTCQANNQGSDLEFLVEVMRRYSNRPDLLGPMLDVLRRIEKGDRQDEPGVCSTGRGGGLVPVRDRLSGEDVSEIIARFRSGVAKHKLAAEYGISLSSVKRLLRCYRDSL